MDSKIKQIIQKEVEKHEYGMDPHHIEVITEAIYKQLNEYMTVEQMHHMLEHIKHEFVGVVDTLIPIVEKYEDKIEAVLDEHIGNFVRNVNN